jgi:glycosyltransferase involved in cell wall biosynthesis
MNTASLSQFQIAIVIPCYNEAVAIPLVIKDSLQFLPEATIHVFDNNSYDETARVAKECGASVHQVNLPGKGNVVRRMFADVDADIYVMLDGDATYDLSVAKVLIRELIENQLDMVIGRREEPLEKDARTYRKGHRLGNQLLTKSVAKIFGGEFIDMLSGYRVFSKRFAKSFPASTKGFEIETELTVHALELRMKYKEIATPYIARPEGSQSKLSTYKDGIKIVLTILKLFASERPFILYSILSLVFLMSALGLFSPILIQYINTGLVLRFPTAFLSMGMVLISISLFFNGLILQTIKLSRNEAKLLAYLRYSPVGATQYEKE